MTKRDKMRKNAGDGATSPTNTPTSSSDDAPVNDTPTGNAATNGTVKATLGATLANAAARGPRRTRPSRPQGAACPLCGGLGFVTPDVPINHPDFGKAVPCRCREQERAQRHVSALQGMASMASLRELTFDTFIPEPSHLDAARSHNLSRAYDTCLYFAQDPEGWLLLSGPYGCGKTHLAAAIANACVAKGKPVVFMVVPDLLDHLRSAYSPTSEISYDALFDQLRSTPLLILDDLGTQSTTPWAQEKLFQLLNHRYVSRLPTVLTTNQRPDEMEPRLRSRLIDPSLVTHFAIIATDFRGGKNAGFGDLSTLHLHREQTFETFDRNRRDLAADERINLQEALTACEEFAREPRGWLVLAGISGCGKTHLAAAIANQVAASTEDDVMFVVVPDLLDHLRAAFGPQSAVSYDRLFQEVRKTSLLVLDDLGTESATPWAKEKLFQLLNYRYSAHLATVITTSDTPNELEPRLRSRMFDTDRCRFCGVLAPPYLRPRQTETPTRRTRRTQ
jgi:DNA replication protein DnaC